MSGLKANGSPPPLRPKLPPEYPDLYGKRRELAKLQVLEREIGFLEDELKSAEGLQPASRSCKEVAEFVTCSADPFIPLTKKSHKSCGFWRWLCGVSSSCCSECSKCSCSNGCVSCRNCCWNSRCFNNTSRCSWNCRMLKCHSCSTTCSIKCRCYPKCPKVNIC